VTYYKNLLDHQGFWLILEQTNTFAGMAKILLIEDDWPIRNAYARALTHKGNVVIECSRGSQALEVIEHQAFDVIMLDILMPELSGIDFLRKARVKERFPTTKIIVLTNAEVAQIEHQAKALGADRFLIKVDYSPYGLAKVLESLIDQ
jgi:CheY-like chemotaxis protein